MNNELEQFEEMLKELKPAQLSDETKAAIEKVPELERLEEALKELKPARLSDETKAAIEKISETANVEKPSHPIPFKRLVWAAAAIILFALIIKFAGPGVAKKPGHDIVKKPEPKVESVVKVEEKKPESKPRNVDPGPFTMDELVTAIHDEGIVEPENGPPVRKLRRDYIRVLNIRDPRTGRKYTVQEPRSDVVFVSLEQY